MLACTALGAGGCASAPDRTDAAGVCKDDGLEWAIGQKAEEPVMRRLYVESGAGLVNPIGPHSVVRGDARNDRLRVYLDKDNTIVRVSCE
ncbi:MAG: hypothetical protein QM761_08350 [Pseudoxanthomonas sp.]